MGPIDSSNQQAEPFIRHAVVAIGALEKIMQSQRTAAGVPRMAVDYPFALNQFDKALRGMRAAISNGENDIRKALIACILVFCFETLMGKPASALSNAESGLMLLYQWMNTNSDQSSSFFLGNSWQEQKIEEVVMDGLAGLDTHVLFFLDTRPIHVHRFMIEGANKSIANMPTSFDSLKTARSFWSLSMRRNYHFIKMALVLGKAELSGGHWNYETHAP